MLTGGPSNYFATATRWDGPVRRGLATTDARYSATKKNKPINAGLAVGAFDSFDTDHVVGDFNPNEEIFRADHTWDWDAKLLASYNFSADVMVSTNFHHQSGEAYARQVRFEGGVTIPDIVLNVEEIGAPPFTEC